LTAPVAHTHCSWELYQLIEYHLELRGTSSTSHLLCAWTARHQPSSPAPFLRPHHVLHSPASALARQPRTTTSPLLLHIPAACLLNPQRGSLGVKHCAIANLASAHHVNSLAANQLPRLSDSTRPMPGCPAGTLLPYPLSVPLLMVLLTTTNMAVVHRLVHQSHTGVSPLLCSRLTRQNTCPLALPVQTSTQQLSTIHRYVYKHSNLLTNVLRSTLCCPPAQQ
jgi:hypothetical protein